MRTIIIGDIHGCYRELVKLLKKVEFLETEDKLIILGDLMDRGKQSYEVFDYFRRLNLRMNDRFILIRGNHEVMLMDAVSDRIMLQLWYQNGGKETNQSFQKHRDKPENHAAWFEQNTVLFYAEERFQCVHAGIRDENPAKNSETTMLWDRSVLECNEYQGKLTIVGHTPLGDATHFTGDWSDTGPLAYGQKLPLPHKGMIGLDTGCVFKGRLTAMVIEDDQYVLESVFWSQEE